MIEFNPECFEQLCREDMIMHQHDGEGIGTYNEKRLHRIFKRYICDDASAYEVKIGRFVADVVNQNQITEIQTSSFRSLVPKISYYLESTDMRVRVLYPMIEQKTIIHMDKESGEVKSARRSPKRETDLSVMANMFYLANAVKNESFELCLAHVSVEEYRFSEPRRYCKRGRYENDLRPISLLSMTTLCCVEDYKMLLPKALPENFCAEEFSRLTGLKKRKLYSVLNFYAKIGVFQINTEKKKYAYSVVN